MRVIGISEDITTRKDLEAELRQNIVELEQRLRKRDLEVQHLHEVTQRKPALQRVREAPEHALEAYATLTAREREIFQRVVCGDMNKTIAAQLSIALATVKVHRGRVMGKFGVDSVARLVALALGSGLVGGVSLH